MPMRFVPFTTQLISTPVLFNSINEGSISIDIEVSTESKKEEGFQNNFDLDEHKDFRYLLF